MAQGPVAMVTGGSRGVGAATVLALAARGYDVMLTYHNKQARADTVAAAARQHGVRALAVGGDITAHDDVAQMMESLRAWSAHLNLLVLNASGGLERDRAGKDSDYPMRINRDAQLNLLDEALVFMPRGAVVVFVTSHWAHLYGRVAQLSGYVRIAESKHAGECALRSRQAELERAGIRLLVVSGDLIEGTITPRLLERAAPGLAAGRRSAIGRLPTTTEMGDAIATAASDPHMANGTTVVVGGALASLLCR